MIQLKPKQQLVIDYFNDSSIDVIVLIGSIETGKTYVAAFVMVSAAYTFANTFIPLIRLNKTTAKQTLFRTYLKVLADMEFIEGVHYSLERNIGEIRILGNQSSLVLTEADHTKDPDHMKIKGLEPNVEHIDEIDELVESAYDMLQSRVGRDPKHKAPRKTVVTMNPNNKWPKTRFYDAWKKGTLPSNIRVVEFTRYDSWSDQSRYDKLLESRPKPWIERYINNNWDFADDMDSLFKYRHFDAALTSAIDKNDPRFIGYDVARAPGGDRSVLALWYGRTLVDIQIIKPSETEMSTDLQAYEIIKCMQQESVIAQHVSVDGVGNGVGVIDNMKAKGISPREFISGGTPSEPTYQDLRSQVIYEFARGLEKGTIQIYEGCPFRQELVSEAMAHNHEVTDKKLKVEPKDKVKERTGGMSPDIFDAVVMGLYPQLSLNPQDDITRVDW